MPGLAALGSLATGAVVAVFVIKPNGILALPVQSSPAVLAATRCWAGWRGARVTGSRESSARRRRF